ncbi:cytochrome c peroxidase [Thiogranum longum]|uniref:Cytochrome c peroxidase n=1 Tax=Thiogranum longum TaxID=1537524 RepID=A0A4R1HEM6_9GAMM|nr:cytochrome c peroxidase [Thiogranum longum]TCK19103.1 cytochrome c peroxidase [Thiogranum longum]
MLKHSRLVQGLLVWFLATGVAMAANWQALPDKAPEPADNPTTAEKVELGQMLYFDPRFSQTGTVSCNSCHNLMLGGDDNRNFSMGVHGKTGGRSAPTVWNAAFASSQFWNGRAASLEEQAKGPVVNPVEMGMSDLEKAMSRVRAIPGYKPYFERAFGGKDPVTVDNAAKAVAAFERTLITPNSPYDRFVKGDKTALTAQQQRGMQAFADTGCTSCHSGPAFNGPAMPAGTGFFMKFPTFTDNSYVKKYDFMKDKGRFESTGNKVDMYLFKVPTLRNVSLTAPYFHNGSVATLGEAIRVMAKLQLNADLDDTKVADIEAFLNALTGEFPEQKLPRLPATPGWSLLSGN